MMNKFILLADGRSGGNLVGRSLNQHPDIYCDSTESFLFDDHKRMSLEEWIGSSYFPLNKPAAIESTAKWKGFRCQYATNNPSHNFWVTDLIRWAMDEGWTIIHLVREDSVDKALSSIISKANKAWEGIPYEDRTVHVNVDSLVQYCFTHKATVKKFQNILQGGKFIEIYYESFLEKWNTSIEWVQRALGVDVISLGQATKKQSNKPLIEYVRNREELEAAISPVTWTKWINEVIYNGNWWATEEARRVICKAAGKAWARSIGLKVARTLPLDRPFVIKPLEGCNANGIKLVKDPSSYLVEELLEDVEGFSPPRDFRFYCFNGKVHFFSESRHENHEKLSEINWMRHWWADGRPCDIDTKYGFRPDQPPVGVPKKVLNEMFGISEKIASEFDLSFIRVDLYYTPKGVYFGELCATPGLVMGKRIKKEWDQHFGKVLYGGEKAGSVQEINRLT